MNKNINTFNLWAMDGRDEKMEKNHLDSVNEMITIIEENSNNLESPFNFLDIGCGNGWVVRRFLEYENCKYSMGIDGAENMIKKAKSYNIGHFEQQNIESYNYKQKFDIVFSMETLYYIENIDNFFKNLYENGLNDGSSFIMGIDHYKENTSSLDWAEKYNLSLNTLEINDWYNLFSKYRFKNIKIYQHGKKENWEGTLIMVGNK